MPRIGVLSLSSIFSGHSEAAHGFCVEYKGSLCLGRQMTTHLAVLAVLAELRLSRDFIRPLSSLPRTWTVLTTSYPPSFPQRSLKFRRTERIMVRAAEHTASSLDTPILHHHSKGSLYDALYHILTYSLTGTQRPLQRS